jgi:hypothetical protein
MTDQDFWFEPVSLLTKCSLNEGLLWVWADRVPVSNVYREKNAFETLSVGECEYLGIPPVPEGVRRVAHHLTEERLRRTFSRITPKDLPDHLEYHVAEGLQQADAIREWLAQIDPALELPAAELFLKLRRGEIEAQGKLLPPDAQVVDFVEQDNPYGRSDFDDLTDTAVPPEFWTMGGIDWIANAVSARGRCYCDVSMSVAPLMSLFPGSRTPVRRAEFVGDYLLVLESDEENAPHAPPKRTPGRPTVFGWDAFHVEVADLIRSGRMPQKKEAGIQQMLSWFESTQGGKKPSRSAVSEKLTLYYRRLISEKT